MRGLVFADVPAQPATASAAGAKNYPLYWSILYVN